MSAASETIGAAFGVVGLAVMGRNLALNVADHGFKTAIWNREEGEAATLASQNPDLPLVPTGSLEDFVQALARPRKIFMLIRAGDPVDQMLGRLKPLLEEGDIVMDGGNSRFQDTRRREAAFREAKLCFMGVGVSGGEEGARHGPSLMPGGAPDAYEAMRPIFEAIAAQSNSGPCVTHVGPDGAGHFVKMVHNGIEYADMQLLAEAYDLLARGLKLKPPELAKVFGHWNKGPLASFLVEITAKIFTVKDGETGQWLVDLVLDKAGQKGTGKWTAEVALDLGVPVPTIAAAIDARVLSSQKSERVHAAGIIDGPSEIPEVGDPVRFANSVHDALLAAKLVCYAQGMDLIRRGSEAFGWRIDLREMARIWKAGCIIRAELLDDIMGAYGDSPKLPNLLLASRFKGALAKASHGWRSTIAFGAMCGIPLPAFTSSLSYFDALRTARLPQNLTQAQRDAFGSHTYERTDHTERGPIHSQWL